MPVCSPWRPTSGREQALDAMMTTETGDSQRGLTLRTARKSCCGATMAVDFRPEHPDIPPVRRDRTKALWPYRRILFEPPFPPMCVEDGNQPLLRACLGAFSRF